MNPLANAEKPGPMNPSRANREAAASVGPGAPRRPLGLGSAAALVVASMIGTGVFTTSGFLLADLGSPWAVLAVWVAGGILASHLPGFHLTAAVAVGMGVAVVAVLRLPLSAVVIATLLAGKSGAGIGSSLSIL